MIITAGFLRKDTVEFGQHVDVQAQASRQHPAKRLKKTDEADMRKERPRWRQVSPENPNKLNLSK